VEPEVRNVVAGNILPPLAAVYQMTELPFTATLLTLGLAEAQKFWLAAPVGGAVEYTVRTGVSARSALVQPVTEFATIL
jgi:hypothetical protein